MRQRLAAVLLCAGYASRMAAFKPLLPLGNRPLIAHVLETVCGAVPPAAVHVVLGHRAGDLSPLVRAAGARVVFNPDFSQGMYASVCAGIRDLDRDTDAFFLLPADIPLVRPATFRRLTEARGGSPNPIRYPVFDGQRGHPPLIPADLIPAVLRGSGQGGLKAVLDGHETRAQTIAVADEHILFDVDRPEDYDAAVQRFSVWGDPSPAECAWILSDVHPVPEAVVRHGRRVRQIATALCRALNRAGDGIDENRVAAAAFLHDIAKGAPDHAEKGGRMLAALGFPQVGDILAAHTDLPEKELLHPGAAAVVYLADKLVSGDRCLPLEARFDIALQRFGDNPAARTAALQRKATAVALRRWIEQCTGHPLARILTAAGIHCLSGSQ